MRPSLPLLLLLAGCETPETPPPLADTRLELFLDSESTARVQVLVDGEELREESLAIPTTAEDVRRVALGLEQAFRDPGSPLPRNRHWWVYLPEDTRHATIEAVTLPLASFRPTSVSLAVEGAPEEGAALPDAFWGIAPQFAVPPPAKVLLHRGEDSLWGTALSPPLDTVLDALPELGCDQFDDPDLRRACDRGGRPSPAPVDLGGPSGCFLPPTRFLDGPLDVPRLTTALAPFAGLDFDLEAYPTLPAHAFLAVLRAGEQGGVGLVPTELEVAPDGEVPDCRAEIRSVQQLEVAAAEWFGSQDTLVIAAQPEPEVNAPDPLDLDNTVPSDRARPEAEESLAADPNHVRLRLDVEEPVSVNCAGLQTAVTEPGGDVFLEPWKAPATCLVTAADNTRGVFQAHGSGHFRCSRRDGGLDCAAVPGDGISNGRLTLGLRVVPGSGGDVLRLKVFVDDRLEYTWRESEGSPLPPEVVLDAAPGQREIRAEAQFRWTNAQATVDGSYPAQVLADGSSRLDLELKPRPGIGPTWERQVMRFSQSGSPAGAPSDEEEAPNTLDRAPYDLVVTEALDRFYQCYEQARGLRREPEGTVVVRAKIHTGGRVEIADIVSTTLRSKPVETCLTERMAQLVFPEPPAGGVVFLRWSFDFPPE